MIFAIFQCFFKVFDSTKFHKKDLQIYILLFYLRKLSRFWGQLSGASLVIIKITVTFLSKEKNIFLDPFFMQFCAPKKSDGDFLKKGKIWSCLLYTMYSVVCAIHTTSAKFDVKIILNKVNKRKHPKPVFLCT